MQLYAASDLHSNNSFVVVIDPEDRTLYSKRLRDDLQAIVGALRSCLGEIQAVAVESTIIGIGSSTACKKQASRSVW